MDRLNLTFVQNAEFRLEMQIFDAIGDIGYDGTVPMVQNSLLRVPIRDGSCISRFPRIFLEADKLSIFMLDIPSLMVNWKTSFSSQMRFYSNLRPYEICETFLTSHTRWVDMSILYDSTRPFQTYFGMNFIYFSQQNLYDSERINQVISVYIGSKVDYTV